MKQTVTYQQLETIANDIGHLMETSPAFNLFNKEKINRFFDKNKQRLEVAMEKRNELIRLYVKHEKGEPVIIEKDGQPVYDFATEEDQDKYLQELNGFMSRSFDLQF